MNDEGTHIDIVLAAPDDGGPIVDVDHDVAALRYAIAFDPDVIYDADDQWTVLRSGMAMAPPLDVVLDETHPQWRIVANATADRLIISLVARADLDGSGAVDFDDLLIVLSTWGPCLGGGCAADLDGNGAVDFNDLILILADWSAS